MESIFSNHIIPEQAIIQIYSYQRVLSDNLIRVYIFKVACLIIIEDTAKYCIIISSTSFSRMSHHRCVGDVKRINLLSLRLIQLLRQCPSENVILPRAGRSVRGLTLTAIEVGM